VITRISWLSLNDCIVMHLEKNNQVGAKLWIEQIRALSLNDLWMLKNITLRELVVFIHRTHK